MRAIAPAAVAAACLALAGCESTQEKSAQLAKQGDAPFKQKGLHVGRKSADVKVGSTAVVSDANGTAVVVALRNQSGRALAGVPVAINVVDGRGKTVFKNDAPGIEPSLTSVPVLDPRQVVLWVNDQVSAAGPAKKVKVLVGVQHGLAPATLPKLKLSAPTLQNDVTSGINASASVKNESKIEQRKLVIYAVARKGARIVAAGRAGIARLRPGKSANFHVYFIGNPRGATITLAAPPTVLQ